MSPKLNQDMVDPSGALEKFGAQGRIELGARDGHDRVLR